MKNLNLYIDVKKIYYDGALILENKNYDEFFFDF